MVNDNAPSYAQRRDPARHRRLVAAANRAKYKAVKELIARHPLEFDRLYAERAAEEGFVPAGRRSAVQADVLAREIERLQGMLAESKEAVG